MKKVINEKAMGLIFNTLVILMFMYLFWQCLCMTGINVDIKDEHIYFQKDSILLNMCKLLCAMIVLYGVGKLANFFQSEKRRNILLLVCCVIVAGISFYWVMNNGTAPQADQENVARHADLMNAGDFSGLQKGAYIANCPQQLGILTFLRLCFSIFGEYNYYAFQLIVATMVPVIVFSGCMIVRHLSESSARAELYYLLFASTCFPMYAYTPFVYGDLISVPFVFIAVWMLLSVLKRFRVCKLLVMGIAIGLAVFLRTNTIIFVIAMMIVVLIKLCTAFSKQTCQVGIAILVGVLIPQMVLSLLYTSKTEQAAEGIPALAYIAMGLNDEAFPGWYNGYAQVLFAESNYDAEVASKEAWQTIKGHIASYVEDPLYMLDFFCRKINSQWNAPMYQCIQMNSLVVEEQSILIAKIYLKGKTNWVVENYAKIHQLVIYGAVLSLLFLNRKKWKDIEKYALLIAIFGGFLFSIIWEAKARYVFPYFLMMIPYAAIGMNAVIDTIDKKITEKKA